MLQNMRDNMKGTVAFIIVGFLAFIMAASLVNLSSTGHGGNYGDIATVNGEAITERELQIALGQEKQRLQAQFGNNLPAEFLSDERLRGPVLQGLVQRTVLLDKANNGKMTVSDSELDKLITEMPEFQTDGRFDSNLFVQGVRRIGHTPVSFRALLRDDVITNQLRNGLASTAFITEAELKQVVSLSRQTRDFSWVTLPLADLPEKMTVSEEEIQSYYDENKGSYNTEEKVSIEYIELKVSDIAETLEVSEEEIQQQYQQEVNNYALSTEREAAHIMIEGDDDAAKKKLADVQEKLAAGEEFATLAAEYSDDFGSRESGGNLGVTTGDSFPDEFETALVELSAGEVSEPIQIDNATHIIKLLSVKENTPPTFEESKLRIASELKSLQAEEIFIEKLTELKDLSYNAESLNEVAEQLSLTAQTTGLFTRAGGDEAVLSDNRVVNAAFSDQVLQQGYTSDVLELSPDQIVVINLAEHQPVRTLTLDEKRTELDTELKLAKAKEQVAKQAEELKTALESGTPLETLAEQNNLTLNKEVGTNRENSGQAPELIEHVFSLTRPESLDKPVNSSLYLSNNDYALVSLSAVEDAVFDDLTDEEQRGARLSLARSASVDEFRAWQSMVVDKAEVDISGSASTN
ncbi:MAG: SurA N-terminal domain-containing protein [Cellvibrionaceae bacterium]